MPAFLTEIFGGEKRAKNNVEYVGRTFVKELTVVRGSRAKILLGNILPPRQ